ncbi:MAG: glycosyltransferase [Deltaproteobacteria bacterium]
MAGSGRKHRIAKAVIRAGQQHIGRHIPYPIRTRLRRLLGLPPKPPPRMASEVGLLAWSAGVAALPTTFDIVCFPIIAWDFRFQRPQQLMREMARRGHRIFWIDPHALLHGEHLQPGAAPLLTRIEDGIIRVAPGMESVRNVYQDELDTGNQRALVASLDLLARQEGIASALSIVQLPFWADAALAMRERGWPLLYDCMDDHADFATNTPAMTGAEERLAAGADTVVVTAHALHGKMRPLNPRIVRIPNGCDVEHFAARKPAPARPAEMDGLAGKIIGYFGAISAWFDFDMLRHAAAAHPQWSFVLIGSTFGAPPHDDLRALPNVHFLGERPYAELPAYLAHFDVATIPFQLTPLVQATDPVKAYEYLAAGKPVVASDLPELRPYGDLFRLAKSPEEFTKELELALAENQLRPARARRAFAEANSWQARGTALTAAAAESFPLVSLIIVTWNNLGFTEQCVKSILSDTTWPHIELIFVDNGSSDATAAWLAELAREDPRVRLIRNRDNRGFAAANNQGLAAAAGDFLVLLNNDTVLPRGWLARLLRNLRCDESIGLIGPVTNNVWNEARQEAGYEDLGGLAIFAEDWARVHQGQRYPIDVLAMYCVALPRRVFAEVGPLDERYGVGMFEDDDYSHRIRAAGYRVVCAEEVYIHHAGRASFRKLSDARYRALHDQNREIYEDKWACHWRPHQGDRHATRQGQGQIQSLIANHPDGEVIVFLPGIGWSIDLFQRPQQLALALGRLGHLVFFCLHDYDAKDGPGLQQVAQGVHLSSLPLCAFDETRGARVFALPYNAYETAYFPHSTIIYESIDEIEVFGGNPTRLRREHSRMVREADIVIATADRLLDGLKATRSDALLVPNGVDLAHFATTETAGARRFADLPRPIIGYFGALARWVDYDLIAALARARPEWSFVLIGPDHDGTAAASGLAALPNVELPGAVPYAEIPSCLAAFDVATIPFQVMPLTRAVSPLKLFEYMAGGCPIVSAALPECARIDLVRIATGRDEWLEALAHGIEERRDPDARAALRAQASAHTWEIRVQQIMQAVDAATASRRAS